MSGSEGQKALDGSKSSHTSSFWPLYGLVYTRENKSLLAEVPVTLASSSWLIDVGQNQVSLYDLFLQFAFLSDAPVLLCWRIFDLCYCL